MPYRLRALLVTVLLDKLDAEGQIVDECTTQPIKVFPGQCDAIATDVAALIARLDEQEASKAP